MNKLPLKIAFRYLFAKKSHSAVNIITIVSTVSVIIATIAIVCVLSIFNGFTGLVHQRLSRIDPPIQITSSVGKTINDVDSITTLIKSLQGVGYVVPTIEEQALAIYGEHQQPITIKGVSAGYDSITDIRGLVKSDGEYILECDDISLAVVSVGVAISLSAYPNYGTLLRVYAPRRYGRVNLSNPMSSFRSDSLFISGVFQSNDIAVDQAHIITRYELASKLLEYDNQATTIDVSPLNSGDERSLIRELKATLGDGYIIKDRLEQQQTSFQMINIEKWITFLLLAFILIIATFNVISTISVLVIEKSDSIVSLKNLGATNRQVTMIFVIESWLISIVGAIIGVVIGVTISLIQQYFGVLKLAGDPTKLIVDAYPVIVDPADIGVILLLVAFIGLLTSIATLKIVKPRLSSVRF